MNMALLRTVARERIVVSKGVSKHEMGVRPWALAAAVCLPAMLGCTELDFEDDNCVSLEMEPCNAGGGGSAGTPNSGGSAGAAAPDPNWACIGEPPPVHDLPAIPGVAYVVPIVDFANPAIVPDVKIDVCVITDFNCMSPITSRLPPIIQADPEARPYLWQITLPSQPMPFEGYLRLTATGYLTTDYHFGGPMIGNAENPAMPNIIVGQVIGMPRIAFIDDFFRQLSPESRNMAAGLLALRVLNCKNERSAGVELDLTNDTALGWSIQNNVPVNDKLNPTASFPTDAQGIAGFANIVAPTNAIVEAVIPGSDQRYGYHAWPVRANQLTLAELRTDYSYGR
jgi:hypothetical protein